MFRCLLWALPAAVQPEALLIADNLCLRQQSFIAASYVRALTMRIGVSGFWRVAGSAAGGPLPSS